MQKLKTHAKEMEEDTKKIGLKRKIKKGSLFFPFVSLNWFPPLFLW
jgi:hypothetical protein